jgi:hypothetical protein
MDYLLLALIVVLTAFVVNLYLTLRHYQRIDYKAILNDELRMKALDHRLDQVCRLVQEAQIERVRLRNEVEGMLNRAKEQRPASSDAPARRQPVATAVEFTSAVYQEAQRMLDAGDEPWKVAMTLRLSMSEVETIARLKEVQGYTRPNRMFEA